MAKALSREAEEQIRRMIQQEHMRLIQPPLNVSRRKRVATSNAGVPFVNESGETVPPYAVMQIESIDDNGVHHIVKPDNRISYLGYLVNKAGEVFDNYPGQGHYLIDKPGICLVYYLDSEGGVPIARNHFTNLAPESGKWYLSNGTDQISDDSEDGFGFVLYDATGLDGVETDGETPLPCMVQQYLEQPQLSRYDSINTWVNSSNSNVTSLANGETAYLVPSGNNTTYNYRTGIKKNTSITTLPDDGFFIVQRTGVFDVRIQFTIKLVTTPTTNYYEELDTGETDTHTHTYNSWRDWNFIANHRVTVGLTTGFGGYTYTMFTEDFTPPMGQRRITRACHMQAQFIQDDHITPYITLSNVNTLSTDYDFTIEPGSTAYGENHISFNRLRYQGGQH